MLNLMYAAPTFLFPTTQVVRRRLAVNEPYLLAGGFSYEEGEGLEEDEVRI
jgi:hypothetical protein